MWVFIMGVVYKILVLVIELKVLQMVRNRLVRITMVILGKLHLYKRKDKEGEAGPVDGDVEAERQRVDRMISSDHCDQGGYASDNDKDAFIVHRIKKTYPNTSQSVVVNNVSFGVRPGECFGLLGVNRAGLCMFRML